MHFQNTKVAGKLLSLAEGRGTLKFDGQILMRTKNTSQKVACPQPQKLPLNRCPLANLSRQTRNGNIINANYQQIESSIRTSVRVYYFCGQR